MHLARLGNPDIKATLQTALSLTSREIHLFLTVKQSEFSRARDSSELEQLSVFVTQNVTIQNINWKDKTD